VTRAGNDDRERRGNDDEVMMDEAGTHQGKDAA
jgi:hypothetical protein